jgi:hypothetical protein
MIATSRSDSSGRLNFWPRMAYENLSRPGPKIYHLRRDRRASPLGTPLQGLRPLGPPWGALTLGPPLGRFTPGPFGGHYP